MTIAALAKETAAFCVACLSLSWEARDIAATGVPLVALVGLGKALWDKCPERLTKATVEAVLRDMDRALPDARIEAVRRALAGLPSTVRLTRETLVQAARADGELPNAIVAAVMAHLDPALDHDTRALAETALATGFRVTRTTPEFRQHLTETLILQAARDHGVMLEQLGRIEDKVDFLPGQFAALLGNLANASRPELVAVAQRFEIDRAEDLTDAALRRELEKRAEDWRAMRVQIEAIPETLKQLSNLKGAAQAAFDVGRFDEVEDLLGRVQEVELEEAARTAELRAETALLRGRVEQAYTLLTTAADSFAAVDPLEPARRRVNTFRVLYFHGLRYGGGGLALAARMLRPVVTKRVRGKDPVLWGKAQNNLGEAFRAQGSRTDGPQGAALLGQAVAAYAAAQEVYTRKDHPVQWATTQNNLGNALSAQGSRTDGPQGAALLGQAVAAYAAALEVYSRKDHPVNWATTQNNLGAELWAQGIRTDGPTGAALLGQAVAAYAAALEVYTRRDHPVDWAMTQNNLGAALWAQGSRTDGPQGAALLGQAVAAYAAALEVRTRTDHPVDWAMTQNNLGAALRAQGSRTDGPQGAALLGQAVAAFAAALEVYTRRDHPVDWARTQNNLGNALSDQGERTDGPQGASLLGQAVSAYAAALEVYTRKDHPVDWAMTQENLAIAHLALANHDTCTDPVPPLRKALEHVTAALQVYDPQHMPYDHGTATTLRDRLLKRLG